MPDPFISAQDLTDMYGIDVTADAGTVIALDAACDICRTIADQPFNAGTATVTVDGPGTDVLILPEYPVTTAGTVVVHGGTITDYMLSSNGLLLRGVSGGWPRPVWPRGRQNIQVTYEFGYSTDNIPRDVRKVALDIAWRSIGQGLASSETVGDATIAYAIPASELSVNEQRILNKYRRPASF